MLQHYCAWRCTLLFININITIIIIIIIITIFIIIIFIIIIFINITITIITIFYFLLFVCFFHYFFMALQMPNRWKESKKEQSSVDGQTHGTSSCSSNGIECKMVVYENMNFKLTSPILLLARTQQKETLNELIFDANTWQLLAAGLFYLVFSASYDLHAFPSRRVYWKGEPIFLWIYWLGIRSWI